jgi:hypothetical protein
VHDRAGARARRIHRFREAWETVASRQLRAGNRAAVDAYQDHDRIVAGPLDNHLGRLAVAWIAQTAVGRSVAITAATNEHVDPINAAIQAARRRIGHLDGERAIAIGGGEHAYPGDVAATRRNARDLRTSTGEPVRNRELWDVVATTADGSLTVSHYTQHGLVTLPAEYAQQHVRLGYAATEHGIQGDTVDIAIELASTATTHRGLYVSATRGRDENRIHVITDTADLAEARDVLEAVLAHDRADIPAVTQRRDLARQAQPAQPRQPQAAPSIPDWVDPWRAQLDQRSDDLVRDLADRADRRAQAAGELADLQPALAAARAAWEPYRTAVAAIEDQLRSQLRPAMWEANHHAMHAGFGHHHTTARRAEAATERVADAQARIAHIHTNAADVKQRLDALEAEARNLTEYAHPSPAAVWLDDLDRQQLSELDELLNAAEICIAWTSGRPVRTLERADAIATLTDVARAAPLLSLSPGEIDQSQWHEFLAPLTELLHQRGLELQPAEAVELEGDVFGIEL